MPQSIVYDARETELPLAVADGEHLWIAPDDLGRATGWQSKPQGLCQGEVCVPVPQGKRAAWFDDGGRLDFAAFAAHLGRGQARDEAHSVWSFGPPGGRGIAEGSGPVVAPDFQLPDLDGRIHSLADHRGKKVLLYCWASW